MKYIPSAEEYFNEKFSFYEKIQMTGFVDAIVQKLERGEGDLSDVEIALTNIPSFIKLLCDTKKEYLAMIDEAEPSDSEKKHALYMLTACVEKYTGLGYNIYKLAKKRILQAARDYSFKTFHQSAFSTLPEDVRRRLVAKAWIYLEKWQ